MAETSTVNRTMRIPETLETFRSQSAYSFCDPSIVRVALRADWLLRRATRVQESSDGR
jgi:hypothetical protein